MKPGFPAGRLARIVIVIALALLAALAWYLWFREPAAPEVATAPAAVADIEHTVMASGTLEAAQLVSVGAQVSGQIKSLKVELGDRVKAGDLIAEIDSTTQENEVRNAEAALRTAQAQRAAEVATFREAELAFQRQRTLVDQQLVARADFDTAEATLNASRARIAQFDAQIEQASTNLDNARALLGYTRIVAPMDGTVVAVVVQEGQTVNAMQAAPTIIKLARLETMLVSAEISEADVIRVQPGQKVWFTVLGNPDRRYEGKLLSIEPAPTSIQQEQTASSASSNSTSTNQAIYYNARFEVPNPDGELRISMTAQVNVVLAEAKQVLTIPATALGPRQPDGSYEVQVRDAQGQVQKRRIVAGINNNTVVQVLEGLQAGEEVVIGDATQAAESGQPPRRRGMRML